jgi:phosphoserine phosphatase RsbU/P
VQRFFAIRSRSGSALGRSPRRLPSVLEAFDRKYLRDLTVVGVVYSVAGSLGLAVPFTDGNVSPIWPAAGVALAALLRNGLRMWPAIALGAFLVNVVTPVSAGAALALAAGNAAGPAAGAWLLRRLPGFSASLTRLHDVLGLMCLAAPASAAISATVGVTVLFLAGTDPWSAFWPAWLMWWGGDWTGILIVVPLARMLLMWRPITQGRQAEFAALLGAVVITSSVVFDGRIVPVIQNDVLVLALLPLVLWGATRFEIAGAAAVTLLVACMAVWETRRGLGPFVRDGALQNAATLQAFIGVIAVSGLTLAAAIAEKAHVVRQQAQREANQQNERRYREIVETANDGIWMLDAHLVTAFVNPRMADMLGYTVGEMVGSPLSRFMSEEVWHREQATLTRPDVALRDHGPGQYRRKDGSTLWATVSRTRAFDEEGTFAGVLEMVSDISDQKRAEVERQTALDSLALLSAAVEQTADSVLISDSTGRIEYVNAAFEETTGYTREEALGNTPRLLKSGRHGEAFYRQMWRDLLDGTPYRGTLVNRKKTGELYWANQTITPIKNPYGTITHFVSVLKDVTEARRYHQQEVQLRLARAVQQRFNPVPPRLSGFDIAASSYPALETGGDYFDFIEAPGGIVYVAIGDVSGHGFDAALIMALTRAYIRSFAALGMGVGEILSRANRAIIEDVEENRFVTMLLVRLDVRARTMTFAGAGHVPGLLLGGTGGVDCVLDSAGVPLGIFAAPAYPERQVLFSAAQILVLSTDGAAETSNPDGAEFGFDGLIGYVSSHASDSAREIAEGIYAAARRFAATEPQHDDITSVIIKLTESPWSS